MLSLNTPTEAATQIAAAIKQARLARKLTQAGLAERAGVNLATYRRFERTGQISLLGYLKVMAAVGLLERAVAASEQERRDYESLDAVLKAQAAALKLPKRGSRS